MKQSFLFPFLFLITDKMSDVDMTKKNSVIQQTTGGGKNYGAFFWDFKTLKRVFTPPDVV